MSPFQSARLAAAQVNQSRAGDRVRLAAASVWPDAYVALLIGLACMIALASENALERLTIAKVLPGPLTTVYLLVMLGGCVVVIWSISRRHAVTAGRGMIVLSLLLGFNGSAICLQFGGEAPVSMAAYYVAALLMMNRSFVLTKRLLVPWWLGDIVPPAPGSSDLAPPLPHRR